MKKNKNRKKEGIINENRQDEKRNQRNKTSQRSTTKKSLSLVYMAVKSSEIRNRHFS